MSLNSEMIVLLKWLSIGGSRSRGGLKGSLEPPFEKKEGRGGAVDRASDFGPSSPWFDSPPVHISLWLALSMSHLPSA